MRKIAFLCIAFLQSVMLLSCDGTRNRPDSQARREITEICRRLGRQYGVIVTGVPLESFSRYEFSISCDELLNVSEARLLFVKFFRSAQEEINTNSLLCRLVPHQSVSIDGLGPDMVCYPPNEELFPDHVAFVFLHQGQIRYYRADTSGEKMSLVLLHTELWDDAVRIVNEKSAV